ncbi:MAG: DUF4199 domain-containing protein [Acidobacteriota bacterium]|nr:MAG: DUF4199 domain-containing protein [Acidobacteriota bacterium]
MKTEIKWGLFFALMAFLWICLEFAVGLHGRYISMHPIITNLFIIPAVYIMYLAIREKKNLLGGKITFGQAFMCGLGVSVIVAILSPLSQFIFHRFVNPNYFTNAINYVTSAGKMTEAEATAYFSLQSYMLQSSLGAIVAGVITSLIIAAIVRTKTA